MVSKYIGAQANEIFVGNVPAKEGVPEYLSGLKTVRLGEQALDIDGNKISKDYMLPMFINRSESDAHHRIMMKRTFPNQAVW